MASSGDNSDALRTEDTRGALLDQLAHLSDEVEALKQHLSLIPEEVLTGRPLDTEPSFKEIYILLARFDEDVYVPALEHVTEGDSATLELPTAEALLGDGAWNECEMAQIIERVRASRTRLVSLLNALTIEKWHRPVTFDGERTDVFGLAYAIVQHDSALLRSAGYRLHESRLTSREEDLPK